MMLAHDARRFFFAFSTLSFAVLAPLACSSTGDAPPGGAAGGPGAGSSGAGSLDGGDQGSKGSPAWTRVTLDADVRPYEVVADARGVWLAEGHGSETERSVGAGRILPSGAYERVFEKTPGSTVLSNYVISAIAPVDDTSAAITAEWFTQIIGGKKQTLETTTAYGTSVFARSASELWVGSRVGTLERFTLPSEDKLRVPIVRAGSIDGIWATKDAVFVVTANGIRRAPLPLPADWNGDARFVVQGDFLQLRGLVDRDVAYAVGKAGLAARYDAGSKSWQRITTGAKGDIGLLAIASEDDVWTGGADGMMHFDGKTWTRVGGEPGMPASPSSIAAQPDGTLWAIADGALHRRAPGAVTGTKTDGGVVVTPDAGTCGFAEPNDDFATAYGLTIPATFDACAPPNDGDRYSFVSPKSSPAGGFYSIAVEDLDSVELLATLYDVTASSEERWFARALNGGASTMLHGHVPVQSERAFDFFVGSAVKPGKEGRYHVAISYTPFVDSFEPNNETETSKTITAGTPVTSLLPTGMPDFEDYSNADTQDYYVLARGAGPFTVTLTGVAAGSIAKVTAYAAISPKGSAGTVLGTAESASPGASVTLDGSLGGSGYLRILVEDVATRDLKAATPPAAFTQPYTLVVSP